MQVILKTTATHAEINIILIFSRQIKQAQLNWTKAHSFIFIQYPLWRKKNGEERVKL